MSEFDVDADDNSKFAEQSYWDARFAKEEQFEWCKAWDEFKHLIVPHIQPDDRVLILGCGNSAMGAQMYEDGIRNIVNLDFSSVVIEQMAERCKALTDMKWVCMDMLNMTGFADASFDVVLEKGTLDSLMVNQGDPWHPDPQSWDVMDKALSECSRILKPTGKFLSITFAQPHFRRRHYEVAKYGWTTSWKTFGSSFHFYVYVCDKAAGFQPPQNVLQWSERPSRVTARPWSSDSESEFLGGFNDAVDDEHQQQQQ